jgi:hypothetical protein
MEIFTKEDVDKFLDKFQDPSHEVERIVDMWNWMYHELPKHKHTNDIDILRKYFIERLIMKAYRLGKEHAYMGSLDTIRRKT